MLESLINENDLGQLEDVARTSPPGAFVEIGVYKGGSAYRLYQIAKAEKRGLHLFDTFSGIPFKGDYDRHSVGDFRDTDLTLIKEVMPEAIIHKGIFPDTLPEKLKNVAFVHVDCDQYQSIKDVCNIMPERMAKGGILYFDDYGALPGARKAIEECFDNFNVLKGGKVIIIL